MAMAEFWLHKQSDTVYFTPTYKIKHYGLQCIYNRFLFFGFSKSDRAVTIHQTHDSVCITIFDPQFDTNLDFFISKLNILFM